jgi:hypothetical protein
MEPDGWNRNFQNLAKTARNRNRANQEIGGPREGVFSAKNGDTEFRAFRGFIGCGFNASDFS